jgi:hypothetical protein
MFYYLNINNSELNQILLHIFLCVNTKVKTQSERATMNYDNNS